jgi:hypothetical protein
MGQYFSPGKGSRQHGTAFPKQPPGGPFSRCGGLISQVAGEWLIGMVWCKVVGCMSSRREWKVENRTIYGISGEAAVPQSQLSIWVVSSFMKALLCFWMQQMPRERKALPVDDTILQRVVRFEV